MLKNNKLEQVEAVNSVEKPDNSQSISFESGAEDESCKADDSSDKSADDSTPYKPSSKYKTARQRIMEDLHTVSSVSRLFPIRTPEELIKMRARARGSEAFQDNLVRIVTSSYSYLIVLIFLQI